MQVNMKVRFLLVAALAALMAACGFHLRQAVRLPAALSTLSIAGADVATPLGRDLRRALEQAGTRVVEVGTPATASLRIGANGFSTDVLSVGGNARANEFTLRYRVEFDVVNAAGAVLVEKQSIELSRDFTFDSSQARGIAAEQELLQGELERDMVQAILRRLESRAGAGSG